MNPFALSALPSMAAQPAALLHPDFFLFQNRQKVNKTKHSQSLTFLYIFLQHQEYQHLTEDKTVKLRIAKTCRLIQFLAFLSYCLRSFFLFRNDQKVYRNLQFRLNHPSQPSVKNTQNGCKKLTDLSADLRPWLHWASNIYWRLLQTRSRYAEPTPLAHKANAGPSQEGKGISDNKGYQNLMQRFLLKPATDKGYRGFVAANGLLKTTQTGNKSYQFHRPPWKGQGLPNSNARLKPGGCMVSGVQPHGAYIPRSRTRLPHAPFEGGRNRTLKHLLREKEHTENSGTFCNKFIAQTATRATQKDSFYVVLLQNSRPDVPFRKGRAAGWCVSGVGPSLSTAAIGHSDKAIQPSAANAVHLRYLRLTDDYHNIGNQPERQYDPEGSHPLLQYIQPAHPRRTPGDTGEQKRMGEEPRPYRAGRQVVEAIGQVRIRAARVQRQHPRHPEADDRQQRHPQLLVVQKSHVGGCSRRARRQPARPRPYDQYTALPAGECAVQQAAHQPHKRGSRHGREHIKASYKVGNRTTN